MAVKPWRKNERRIYGNREIFVNGGEKVVFAFCYTEDADGYRVEQYCLPRYLPDSLQNWLDENSFYQFDSLEDVREYVDIMTNYIRKFYPGSEVMSEDVY